MPPSIPAFDAVYGRGRWLKPRVQLLEIRGKAAPEGEMLALVLVERTETVESERDARGRVDIREARIRFDYQRLDGGRHRGAHRGHFNAKYDAWSETLSLTGGAVCLDLDGLEGQRIGTYLMNEVVIWAQQWPQARVEPVRLLPGQAQRGNRARRNRFYERFGLVFDYGDPQGETGVSREMSVSALKNVLSWQQNIRERPMFDVLCGLQDTQDTQGFALRTARFELQRVNKVLDRALAHPVRWALQVLGYRFRENLLEWTTVGLIALLAWRWLS